MKISIEEIEKMDASELWVYADTLEKDGNLENAVKYMQIASDMGEMLATYSLACYYEKGMGVEQDYAKAVSLYEKVAECREALVFADANEPLTPQCDAEYALGLICEKGVVSSLQAKDCIKWYARAIEDGCMDVGACLRMAELYELGLYVSQNYDKSAMYLTLAYSSVCGKDARVYPLANKLLDKTEAYQIDILDILADCFSKGIGTEINEEKANEYREKAQELRDKQEREFLDKYTF